MPRRPNRQKAADKRIHTRSFTGLYRNLRMALPALFLLFFGTVWLNWGGRQAVLWDLAESKFHIFGATFWPQDFILLGAADHLRLRPVRHHRVRRPRVVRLHLPAELLDLAVHVVRKVTEGDRNQRIKLPPRPGA
jgi:hypothetical protein